MSFATNKPQPSTSTSTSVQWSQQPCRQFSYTEILLATQNFSESLVIGHGGFGQVYRGNIMNGSSAVVVAIKRLNSKSSPTEFWAEVDMLSNLRHSHLVSLIGYCIHGNEMIQVYEYMPQGTLEDHLHKHSTPLSWIQLLNICKGVARGLDYLHSGTGIEHGVVHGDVKSSNILLHDNFAAKISDFGLSKIGLKNKSSIKLSPGVRGTDGYLDPNCFKTGRLNTKSDVYAFGVVLLEVLSKKRATEEILGLGAWAQKYIKDGKLKHMVDSGIRDQISAKCLKEFVRIAERCLLDDTEQRPSMTEVVFGLDCVLNLQEKTNNSLQTPGRTIFGRMVDKLPFPSRGDHSAHDDPKLSSDNTGGGRGNASNMFPDSGEVPNPSLRVFKFGDLEKATGNFHQDRVLGQVAFGRVFFGWVDDSRSSRKGVKIPVAIKRRSVSSSLGHAQWLAEVILLGRLAHSNIISLLGYCNHKQEYLLVYEHMNNLSLDRFLHRSAQSSSSSSKQVKPLSWRIRLIILMGVAHGLTYLHSSSVQIIHHDIRSSSILLDQDFNAKLGGFGMATSSHEITKTNVTRSIMGSRAIIAPEYALTGHLSVKCDIYGFGVVLFETLTGLKGAAIMDRYKTHNLAQCASLILQKGGNLKLIIDPSLGHNYPQEGAFKLLTLASKCLANRPEDRPSSEEVLRSLEHIHASS